MSLDYGQGPSSATNITLDLRLLNPFAEDVASGQDEPLTDDMSTRSSTLRRGSLDKDAPNTPNVLREHVKSRTELDVYTGSNSLHPLRSAGLAPGPNDAGVTRPHLSRVLNVGALVDAPPVTVNRNPAFPVETDVLVHQISPGDSLAGVSLKYGISLAELRRTNHLWASDSIHSRTQLYVPIDKASRLTAIPVHNLISITPKEELGDPTKTGNAEHDPQILRRPYDMETIRRVPLSQLSFFPPPVVRPVTSPRSSEESAPPTNMTTHHSRYSSHPSNSFTSLLASLPIAASTRDTIIARLSFESVSSSYSESEMERDSHELDDVSVGSTSEYHDAGDQPPSTATLITPKAAHYSPGFGRQGHSPSSPPTGHARHLSSSPHSYIPSLPEIRTVQMEPSPEMHIPSLSRMQTSSRGKRPARPTPLDSDIELKSCI